MTYKPVFTLPPHHTALRCLFVLALHRGIVLKPENFSGFSDTDTVGSVLRVMTEVGLEGRLLRGCRWSRVNNLSEAFPLMVMIQGGHWIVLLDVVESADGPQVTVLDPQSEQEGTKFVSRADFQAAWSGTLIACRRARKQSVETQPFGLRWFLPEIMRHRGYLRDVGVAALMSTAIAFATPLMFQILIDKVITHRSTQTLITMVLIFAVLTAFDGVFSYTRQYLMTFLTSKIDARLASRVFRHLLSLPMFFFESTTAGIITRHLQQTETIRHFLTGRLFQTLLDAVALPLILMLLLLYSVKLTLVVLGFSAVIAMIIAGMVPTFRRHLENLYQAEGARQGQLVETIHGMRTIKSLAMEPVRIQAWNDAVALGVRRRASVARMAALANVSTQGLEKIMQISILGLGTLDVFDGSLTIGALIAFNMVCGRVTGPLVQIVGLINEYQETSLAVKMLGIVMTHAPERDPGQLGLTPEITGTISFDNVTFRYPGASVPALDAVSFAVEQGQVIGIVGRSGSGKTTVTRLVQGIQTAQEGSIRLDGLDIRHVDLHTSAAASAWSFKKTFCFGDPYAKTSPRHVRRRLSPKLWKPREWRERKSS